MAVFAVFIIIGPAKAQLALDVNSPTDSITAATSTDRVQIPNLGGKNMMITNDSNRTCFLKAGSVTVTAAITDLPVLRNTIQVFSYSTSNTHVAAICNAGVSGKIYISQGPGE